MVNFLTKGNASWLQVCVRQGILPFPKLITYQQAILAFSAIHELTGDLNFKLDVTPPSHDYQTRFSIRQTHNIPVVYLERYKQSSSYALATIWNMIPNDIRELNDLNRFKKKLKFWLLTRLDENSLYDPI